MDKVIYEKMWTGTGRGFRVRITDRGVVFYRLFTPVPDKPPVESWDYVVEQSEFRAVAAAFTAADRAADQKGA